MRRVVITGLGLVTPLACGVEATWARLLAGQSGAVPITKFKVDDLACRIACDVPRGDGSDGSFDPNQWVDAKEHRRIDDFILYGITAFDVQYWDGGNWVNVQDGSVTGNNKVWRQFTFPAITTSKIKVVVHGSADSAFSRIVEVEAWTP